MRVSKRLFAMLALLVAAAWGGAATTANAPQEEAPKSQIVMAFVPSQQAQQVLT